MVRHKIKNAIIVYKRSIYQRYILDKKHHHLKGLYNQGHPSTKKLHAEHEAHTNTLRRVKEELKKHGVKFKTDKRKKLGSLSKYDLIITVGGDGTFLRTAHHVTDQLMIGVNSAPLASVGALCSVTLNEFPKKLKNILDGNFKIKKLNRLEIKVNKKSVLQLALNDVLYCNTCPAGTSRYVLKIGSKKEDHRSSGVWISTAAGSTAAMRAAGGKVLPHFSQNFQYLVREPYQGTHKIYYLPRGLLKPGTKLELLNHTMKAALYIDGMQAIHPLHFGDKITIQNSKYPVHVIL